MEIFRVAGKQWKMKVSSGDFWVVMVTLWCYLALYFLDAGAIFRESGERLNILSVFPALMCDISIYNVVLIGFLFAICDIPAGYPGLELMVIRVSRLKWYAGQLIYLLYITFTYFLLIFLIQLSFYFPAYSIERVWGSPVEDGTAFASQYFDLEERLLSGDVLRACVLLFLLFFLLGVIFGMICCISNFLNKRGWLGVVLCAILLLLNFIRYADNEMIGWLSPIGVITSVYTNTGISVGAGICCLLGVIFLLALAGVRIVSIADVEGRG